MLQKVFVIMFGYLSVLFAGQSVFVPRTVGEDLPPKMEFALEKDGITFNLKVTQEERSPEFELKVQNSAGELIITEPPQMTAYRGFALEDPTQRVVVSVGKEEMEVYFLDTPPERSFDIGDDYYEIDFAFDVDYKYFKLVGNTVESCMRKVDRNMTVTQEVYWRDLKTRYNIVMIVLRADPTNCPYETHVPGLQNPLNMYEHLEEFWKRDFPDLDVDLCHIVTGRGEGSGVAAAGSFCNKNRYYAASSYKGEQYDFYKIFRHEIGHSWGAPDNYGPGPQGETIMWGNDLDFFCDTIIENTMMASRELDCISRLDVPIIDPVTKATIQTKSSVNASILRNQLRLELDGVAFSAEIYDAQGKQLRVYDTQPITSQVVILDIQSGKVPLAEGSYLLKVMLDGAPYVRKLMYLK